MATDLKEMHMAIASLLECSDTFEIFLRDGGPFRSCLRLCGQR